jgi:hypothetical protein
LNGFEVEVGGAPLQNLDVVEVVALDPLHQLFVEGIDMAGDAERAVAQMSAGTPGDLGELGGVEIAELVAVELAVLGEGDVIDVEVEPHADRIRRDQIFDVALLVEFHLRIAGARAERAEHDGGTAALAADQLGDRIDLVGGKGDDGGALRQAGDLLLAGIEQVRQARPLDDGDAGKQVLQDRPHRAGAKQQRLVAAAQMQDAVGEDMAALEIAGQLDLVDGDESGLGLARHGFDGADREAGLGRRDLFFAGDQRDILHADLLDDAAVDLTRQQPQWQADDAGAVRNHALDGIMRLAGVGRAEHRGHAAAAQYHGLRCQRLCPADGAREPRR